LPDGVCLTVSGLKIEDENEHEDDWLRMTPGEAGREARVRRSLILPSRD
jgi:hypothetical protein